MASAFLVLPPELLLVILGELCDIHYFPARRDPPTRSNTFRSIRDLRSLSMVNRRLRRVSLPVIFKMTRCTSSERLARLTAECTVNPQFAGLIRHLDVVDIDTRLLAKLLPFLTSLVRLDLKPDALDTHLLVVVNSHPTIVTVAIRVALLPQLNALATIADLPSSKILVSQTIVNNRQSHQLPHNFDIFPALLERGVRFSHLVLEDKRILDNFGASSLLLHDLEHLDLFFVYGGTNHGSIQNGLLRFAQRHTHLATVKFNDQGWRHDPDAPFAADFQAAMAAERIWTVTLNSFSIARSASWTSLQDWRVTQLELGLSYATGIAALKAANVLAPHLSSLELVLRVVDYTQPCHIDEFAAPFNSMPFLRTLHLSNGYAHLCVNGRSPWIHSQRKTMRSTRDTLGTSTCVTALHALQWYMTRVAQRATGLELIHVTDRGQDGKGRFATPWTLEVTFRVLSNEARDLEVVGSPKLEMAARYRLQIMSSVGRGASHAV